MRRERTSDPMFNSYSPPEARNLRKAKIQPFYAPIVAAPPHGFRGGVVLGNTVADARLRHSRYGIPVDSFHTDTEEYEIVLGDYIYFGPFYNHFGHTMTEFIHRAIPSKFLSTIEKYILVATPQHQLESDRQVPQFLKEIFDFLDIPAHSIKIIFRNSEVENLFICEQGSDFGGGPKDGYLAYLDAYTNLRLDCLVGAVTPTLTTYVSRSKTTGGGNFLGERYVEAQLRDEGIQIFHPQDASIVEQMQMYRASKILIFPEGSACHGIEFFGNNALQECHILERRLDHREIFARIFQGRAKSTSTLSGAISISPIIVHPLTREPLPHTGMAYIPAATLLEYFRSKGIARLHNFLETEYKAAALQDFDRHAELQAKLGADLLNQDEIISIRKRIILEIFDIK